MDADENLVESGLPPGGNCQLRGDNGLLRSSLLMRPSRRLGIRTARSLEACASSSFRPNAWRLSFSFASHRFSPTIRLRICGLCG